MYKTILAKISLFVKGKKRDIILVIIVSLLVMLSFACGYIIARRQQKQQILIEDKVTLWNIYQNT